MAVIAGCKGIEYSSPTVSSAISNLTPAFTFTLAVIFRHHTLRCCICFTYHFTSPALEFIRVKLDNRWPFDYFTLLSYISLTRIMEIYPEEITVVFLYNLCVTLISAPVCLLGERNFTSWILKPDISLAAIMYSGVFVSVFSGLTHTWGLHLKGPVYISLFRPLSIVIVVAMGAIFLGDALHLGSVIGSVILCIGFYTLIWGKAREDTAKNVAGSEHYSPLLLTHIIEDEALPLR
ncbi:hypothetical protein F2Q69_00048581 [Brassica cretica]|uniref:WAT1-related protein n=1 Tax=Brassica cretica TaxID=69181 RepID=A0A8S9PL59_BRACR|nr:hypothetical protein F2Q69_00048581 [Brassica cretica]